MKNSSKPLSLTLLFLLFAHSFLPACSCGPYVPIFCEAVRDRFQVAVVEITETLSPSLKKASIIIDLSEKFARDTVYIIGQDGLNCGEDMNLFSAGDTLLMGLTGWDNDSTYILSACGRTYLEFAGDTVFGPIYQNVNKMSLPDFAENLENCLLLVDIANPDIDPSQLKLFPNPARGGFTLESKSEAIKNISVFNTAGRLLIQEKMPAATKRHQMDLSLLPPGVYITRVLTSLGFITKRVVLL